MKIFFVICSYIIIHVSLLPQLLFISKLFLKEKALCLVSLTALLPEDYFLE